MIVSLQIASASEKVFRAQKTTPNTVSEGVWSCIGFMILVTIVEGVEKTMIIHDTFKLLNDLPKAMLRNYSRFGPIFVGAIPLPALPSQGDQLDGCA